jgi:hypothetical protein
MVFDSPEPLICTGCGHTVLSSPVRVVDIARVKAGWSARGEIQEIYCQVCNQAYALLIHYIPIECAAFACPDCGPGSKLNTEILNITESKTGYSFVAELRCDACAKPRRFSKILGGLSKITRVKVGPMGVEVEVKP